MRATYTRFPRTILWLVPGSEQLEPAGPRSNPRLAIESFYLSKWPITNEQIEAFDPGHCRCELSAGDRDTALGVDFERAQAYCVWYAEVSKKPMRLPTEIEWQHACRSGSRARTFWEANPKTADNYLYDADSFDGHLGAADRKKPNGFGLYGMLGGAWEWTAEGILCGGSFRTPRSEVCCNLTRAAERVSDDETGFRVAKSLR